MGTLPAPRSRGWTRCCRGTARCRAENRSWVNLVAQAGVAAFVEWFRHPGHRRRAISADVFGTAPRELTRSVTLQQTVELVRVVIAVVEERIEEIAPGDEAVMREAVLRYSREIAFAAAQVYAQAAEARGAWDARLESLVVDALIRGEADDSLRSRAAALGWGSHDPVVVAVGQAPDAEPEDVVDEIRAPRAPPTSTCSPGSRATGWSPSSAAPATPLRATRTWSRSSAPAPSWSVPPCATCWRPGHSAAAAVAGLLAAPAWPDAPRPVLADDLLPERALAGDRWPGEHLVDDVYRPLTSARLGAWSKRWPRSWSSRPRSRRRPGCCSCTPTRCATGCAGSTEVTGYAPTDPRDGLHAAPRPGSGPAGRAAGSRSPYFVGSLQRRAGSFVRRRTASRGPTPKVGACSSSSLPVRAPRHPASSPPGSRCPASRTGCAGSPPARAGPGPLRHRGGRRHDPGHRDCPAAAGRRRAARRPRVLPAPRRTPSMSSVPPPGTVSARSPRRPVPA